MDAPAENPVVARPMPARSEFDEQAYLDLYPDVARGVASGHIASGWQHFEAHGFNEGRSWFTQPDALAGVSRAISPHDEMYGGNPDHYFDVGSSALHSIAAALFAARRREASIQQILDLPCGHGRVMRFLRKRFPQACLTACDLNASGVDYCAETFGAQPVHSRPEATDIPLPSATYDLIWCGSLLTHLSEPQCAEFIQLFHRLLRPGGIALFTTHGRRCADELLSGKNRCGLDEAQITTLLAQYQNQGFGYVDYRDQSGYGISLSQPAFILRRFVQTPAWELLGYYESLWDKRQDVVALRRPLL